MRASAVKAVGADIQATCSARTKPISFESFALASFDVIISFHE